LAARVMSVLREVGTVLLAFPICGGLWIWLSGSDRGSYLLLALAFCSFFAHLALWFRPRSGAGHRALKILLAAIALGLVAMLLLERWYLVPLYPLATLPAYALLAEVLLLGIHRWIFSEPHAMHLHFQKRYLLYGLGLLAMLYATTTMDTAHRFGPHFQLKIMVWLLLTLLVVNWFMGQWRMVKALESAKLTAELMHLKAQIHPHFLFNTLNNLYGLAREQSDQTADMIMRFSALLRHGLQQADRERVPLAEEVAYLEHFITLQSLRYAESVEVVTDIEIGPGHPTISPLMLSPLVENAYKHGADRIATGAWLHIELRVEAGVLTFTVENNLPRNAPNAPPGIGLVNLRKRLALVYPDRHDFHFTLAEDRAHASLRIAL